MIMLLNLLHTGRGSALASLASELRQGLLMYYYMYDLSREVAGCKVYRVLVHSKEVCGGRLPSLFMSQSCDSAPDFLVVLQPAILEKRQVSREKAHISRSRDLPRVTVLHVSASGVLICELRLLTWTYVFQWLIASTYCRALLQLFTESIFALSC